MMWCTSDLHFSALNPSLQVSISLTSLLPDFGDRIVLAYYFCLGEILGGWGGVWICGFRKLGIACDPS